MGNVINFNELRRGKIVELLIRDGYDANRIRVAVNTLIFLGKEENDILDMLIRIRSEQINQGNSEGVK